jgi:hypothetical protein
MRKNAVQNIHFTKAKLYACPSGQAGTSTHATKDGDSLKNRATMNTVPPHFINWANKAKFR